MANKLFDNSERMRQEYESLPSVEIQPLQKSATIFQSNSQKAYDKAKDGISQYTPGNLMTQERNNEMLKVLASAPKGFRSAESDMLDAIERNHNAYDYASKELKDNPAFNVAAIQRNPAVYSHLTLEQKMDRQFSDLYMKQMLNKSYEVAVEDGDRVKMPQYKIDKDYPINMDTYKKAYEKQIDDALDKPYGHLCTTRERTCLTIAQNMALQDKQLSDDIKKTEQAVWENRESKVMYIAKNMSAENRNVAEILDKASEVNKEMARKIDDAQEEYWMHPERIQKLADAHSHLDRKSRTLTVCRSRDEQDREAEKMIKEAERRIKRVQEEKAVLAYLKQSNIDYVLGLESAGYISPEDASMSVAFIQSIPSITAQNYTYQSLMTAEINDFDNVREIVQDSIVDMSKIKGYEERVYVARDDAEFKRETPEYLQTRDYDMRERDREWKYSY